MSISRMTVPGGLLFDLPADDAQPAEQARTVWAAAPPPPAAEHPRPDGSTTGNTAEPDAPLPAEASPPPAQPGEILVQFSPDLSPALVEQALASVSGTPAEIIHGAATGPDGLLLRVTLPKGAEEAEAIAVLSTQPGVDFAEENFTVSVDAVSNDASYTNGSLWGMYGDATTSKNAFGSQAGEAWATGETGSAKVVIGVLDTGINYTHADLYLNVWINQGEIPISFRSSLADVDSDGQITFRDLNQAANKSFVTDINRNGRIDAGDLLKDQRWANRDDQDRNGYRDDLFGWDFVNNDNDPFDDNGHGTHVSGTIGAVGGNGVGVAGMAWEVQILALKFIGANGSGSISNAVKALDYYTNAGKAAVGQDFVATNNSWGGAGHSSAMQAAIDRTAEAGNLFIAAAGNNSRDTDRSANYPSSFSTLDSVGHEAVISVAALTSTGSLASFSNYGSATVDLAAPGASILSTTANGGYGTMSGTSMATPHVTGAIALYAAANPEDSAAEIRAALLDSTIATASLAGRTVTGGRLDAEAMLRAGAKPEASAPPAMASLHGTDGRDTVTGTADAEILSGVPASGSHLGRGTVDLLQGLGGDDIFVLGDARGAFYDDGNVRKSGTADYGRILDFQRGDKIQLSDDYDTYIIRSVRIEGVSGMGIYGDADGNGVYSGRDELIGHVKGFISLTSADLIFV